jgi:hypothetical protein
MAANREGPEFAIILASCACGIAELIMAESLYEGHVEILRVIQVMIAI